MVELKHRLHIEHDFSTVYCAWANGLIERVMRDIKALMRIMIHDLRVGRDEWPDLVPLVMFALNQRPARLLSNCSPVEVHMGMKPSTPLDCCFQSKNVKFQTLEWTGNKLEYLTQLHETLDEVHRKAFKQIEKNNQRARQKSVVLPIFEIGDYVLYCLMDRPHQQGKLFFEWIGPMQVVDIKSDYIYSIRNLVNDRVWQVHVTRLSFYSCQQLHVKGDLLNLISVMGQEFEIEELMELIWVPQLAMYQVKVRWVGFSEAEATYENLKDLLSQVPRMVVEFLALERIRSDPDFQTFLDRTQGLLQPMCRSLGLELPQPIRK
jgi:hypothetical protein